MGNRAIVEFPSSHFHKRHKFYLHWHGGPGSVTAFVVVAFCRATRTKSLKEALNYLPPNVDAKRAIPYEFYRVVREWFGDGYSLYVASQDTIGEEDNGHYVVDLNAKLKNTNRRYNPDMEYERKMYAHILEHFGIEPSKNEEEED
jgi:hypothetical protein